MRTSKILSPVLLVVASVVAGGAFASASNANTYPELPASHSTLTRAQVQAEVAQAAKNGTLEMNDATYPVVADAGSPKTRAEVQRETLASSSTAGTVPMQH